MSNNFKSNIAARPWIENTQPKRILAIRLQAMGDTVITLPYLNALRNALPEEAQLDFLTRKEVASIPKSLVLFNHIYLIGGKRNFYKQCISALFILPRLIFRRYDVVLDLQNNLISRSIRRILCVKSWSEFDKYSPLSAGERTRWTIEAAGFKTFVDASFRFKKGDSEEDKLLRACGWDGESKLVILNPAAAFYTRNWSIDNYVSFANLWTREFPHTQFIAMGTNFIKEKAQYLKENLGERLLYMVDSTSAAQGFRIIQRIWFMLSEDSGLMHMSWVSDRPTVALLGNTRSDWVTPPTKRALVFNCNEAGVKSTPKDSVKYNKGCLSICYQPEFIFEQVKEFIARIE